MSEPGARPPRSARIEVAIDRGVFMISVAAELAEMHPQTLRMYEARGLIEPSRSPKGTRLYSQADVERLRRIQQMTAELGLNLAGVERVLELERQMEELQAQMLATEAAAAPRITNTIVGTTNTKNGVRHPNQNASRPPRNAPTNEPTSVPMRWKP